MLPLRPHHPSDEPDDQTNHLLPFSGARGSQHQWVNVRALVDDVLNMLSPQLRSQRVHVEMDVPYSQQVWTDERSLRDCVWNLARNALESMPKGGELAITSYSSAQRFELEIADSGRGISDEFRRRIASPQHCEEDNFGHILNATLRLAAAQGGEVTARNCAEGGAAFYDPLAEPRVESGGVKLHRAAIESLFALLFVHSSR